jgi:succinate dehydrogenase hydrophobic anchor subunit
VIDIGTQRTVSEFQQVQRRSSTWLWQAGTGVLLLFLLTLHMIANHFIVEGGLRDYAQTVEYLRTPVIFVIEHLFLLTVTIHAMLGIRAVLFDFGLAPATEHRITVAISGLGAITVAYGVWLLWAVAF